MDTPPSSSSSSTPSELPTLLPRSPRGSKAPRKTVRGPYICLSLEKKATIIARVDAGESKRSVGKSLGLNESTIRGIYSQRQKIKNAVKTKKKAFKKWQKSKADENYIEYRKERRQTSRIVKKAKEESWKSYGEQLAKKSQEDPRQFFKSVKSMRTRDEPYNPTATINDNNGNPIFNKTLIKDRWKSYFEDLLNPVAVGNQEKFETKESPPEPPILLSEVKLVIKKSPDNKSPGVDEITAEQIKLCGNIGETWIHRIFNTAWKQERTPRDWQQAIIVPIWKKKGSKRDCGTYRGISLLSHVGKMYAKILETRTRPS